MNHQINDNGTERDMTDDEIAAYEIERAASEAITIANAQAEADAIAAKTSARAKLKALGLTDPEIAALIP